KLPVMTAAKMMIAIATAATSSCGSRPLTRRPPPERVPSSLANSAIQPPSSFEDRRALPSSTRPHSGPRIGRAPEQLCPPRPQSPLTTGESGSAEKSEAQTVDCPPSALPPAVSRSLPPSHDGSPPGPCLSFPHELLMTREHSGEIAAAGDPARAPRPRRQHALLTWT